MSEKVNDGRTKSVEIYIILSISLEGIFIVWHVILINVKCHSPLSGIEIVTRGLSYQNSGKFVRLTHSSQYLMKDCLK